MRLAAPTHRRACCWALGPLAVIAAVLCGCTPTGGERRAEERAIKEAIITACDSAWERAGVPREAAIAFLTHEAVDEEAAKQLVSALRLRSLGPDHLVIEWLPRTELERVGSAPRFGIGGDKPAHDWPRGGGVPNAVAKQLAVTARFFRVGRKGPVVFAFIYAKLHTPFRQDALVAFLNCCFENGLYAVHVQWDRAPDCKARLKLQRQAEAGPSAP